MPFVHIKSLPFENKSHVAATLRQISRQLADTNNIDQRHITVTWEYYESQHYLGSGAAGARFDPQHHQIIVDLMVPDFNNAASVETMMHTIATTVMQAMDLPENCIFIRCQLVPSGHVMEGGHIVQW